MDFEEFKKRVDFLVRTVDERKLDVIQADGMLVQKTKHLVEEIRPEIEKKAETFDPEQVAEMSWSLSHAGRY